ncbi:MAG: protein phosphatase 2C domain-containing protein [Vallitaleaceae bacterium]|nr:protein phosphatase 2C domain-containing protein [Vallitaleaceae bacterium]
MINIDTFLKIGDSHKVCEDYVIQGSTPFPYIILSDGCSSSDNTEMGARILCHLAKQYLTYRGDNLYGLDYHKLGQWVIHNAELTARQLGLKVSSLDATLIVSYEIDSVVYVHMYGDGVVVAKDRDGGIGVDFIEFTNNAPYYLTYLLDDFRDHIYHTNKNSKSLNAINPNGRTSNIELAYDHKVILKYETMSCPTIFICSDGIQSFIKKDPSQRDIFPVEAIVPDMMAFKNTKGEFLKRRLKRALKTLNNDGIVHYDDLSIGAYTRIE